MQFLSLSRSLFKHNVASVTCTVHTRIHTVSLSESVVRFSCSNHSAPVMSGCQCFLKSVSHSSLAFGMALSVCAVQDLKLFAVLSFFSVRAIDTLKCTTGSVCVRICIM
jgi:hypothetical protein